MTTVAVPPPLPVPGLSFSVAGIIEILAAQYGLNLEVDGIDDICYGCIINSDMPFIQFLQQHKDIYNYQIVDGNPIRVVRRALNTDLVIDLAINEDDCIPPNPGSPHVKFSRSDPLSLPREVELQYVSIDRSYSVNPQSAKNPAARPQNGKLTVNTSFIISDDQARLLAFDMLYRYWQMQLSAEFEYPDPNIEPSDIIQMTGDSGEFLFLVQTQTLTPDFTSQITATSLLNETGVSIASGSIQAGAGSARLITFGVANAAFVGSPAFTEFTALGEAIVEFES